MAGGISGGAEGAVSGFFEGAAYGALGGVAVASGAGVGAGLLALGAAGAGVASLGFLGKAYYHNPSRENGLVLVGAGAGMIAGIAGGLTAKALTPRTSLVSRTEGGVLPNASWKRVNVDENGNVNIIGARMIHVAIDAKAHSVYFYKLRGGAKSGAEIVTFRIPRKLAEQIKKEAVAQKDGKKYPDAPQIDDPHLSPNIYGLNKKWIDKLNEQAVKGSGRVSQPKNPKIKDPKLRKFYEHRRENK